MRRRRRSRGRLSGFAATLALLCAPAAVGAAAYVAFASHHDPLGSPPSPVVVDASASAAGSRESREPVPTAPEEPREPAPLIEGEPVPSIPLSGVDAVHVPLRRPPRAGLVFDLDTGEVLWRRRPVDVLSIASLGIIGLLAFLTASVVIREGFDILVLVSLIVLALLGFGVLGALTSPPPDG